MSAEAVRLPLRCFVAKAGLRDKDSISRSDTQMFQLKSAILTIFKNKSLKIQRDMVTFNHKVKIIQL